LVPPVLRPPRATRASLRQPPAAPAHTLSLHDALPIFSGLATYGQRQTIMDGVSQRLNTAYGAVLMDPPYHAHAFDGALAVIYNPGTKENAGIFSQSPGWLILAEALCGHGRRAFRYFAETAPA